METSLSQTERPATRLLPLCEGNKIGRRVADVASTVVVKIPTWFTVAAALRVAHLKGASHLLVLDRQKVVGAISQQRLSLSPGSEPVARWMNRSPAQVSPETPQEEAWRLMAMHDIECLPVVSGAMLLGVVAREHLLPADSHGDADCAAAE
jgi:CBS domain-containing protein